MLTDPDLLKSKDKQVSRNLSTLGGVAINEKIEAVDENDVAICLSELE